jgi:peptide/nickel transport system substrate-binding protein
VKQPNPLFRLTQPKKNKIEDPMSKRTYPVFLFMIVVLLLSACQPAAPAPAATTAPAAPAATEAATTAPASTEAAASTTAPAANSANPVTFRVGITDVIQTTNPVISGLLIEDRMFGLFYSFLVYYGQDGQYHNQAAENVTSSTDGKVWTYTIRKDIKFHDGVQLTAKDVAYTFNMLMKHDEVRLHDVTKNFDKAEATDDYTFVLTLKSAVADINNTIDQIEILPEHIWSPIEASSTKLADFANAECIGSGPFKMKEFKKGEYLDMTVNKDYFAGPAQYDELVWQYYSNNDAAVQALISGEVDMLEGAPITALATLKKAKNIQVISSPSVNPSVTDIILNQISKETCAATLKDKGVCTHNPALSDVNVRKALTQATDKQKIIDAVMLGQATPGITLVPRGLGKWFNSDIKDLPFDIAAANKILDDAGYKDVNNDGVRETPDGKTSLDLRLYFPTDYSAAPRIAELLNESWTQIGVKLEIKGLDSDALGTAVNPQFDFDIAIWGWGSSPDPSNMLSVYTTDAIASGRQEIGYSNADYDKLYQQQDTTTDPVARQKLVWQMQDMLFNDFGYIIPYYASANMPFRTDKWTGWPTEKELMLALSFDNFLGVKPIQ